jgi:hypothetical protein
MSAAHVAASVPTTTVAAATAAMSTTTTAAVSVGHLGHRQSDRRCDRAEFQSCSRRHDTPPNRKEIPNEIGSIAAVASRATCDSTAELPQGLVAVHLGFFYASINPAGGLERPKRIKSP